MKNHVQRKIELSGVRTEEKEIIDDESFLSNKLDVHIYLLSGISSEFNEVMNMKYLIDY